MRQSDPMKTRLEYEDIRSGMSLMQTVYTIAMVLGLEKVVEASYGLLISPGRTLSVRVPLHLVPILVSIVLLSIRFFWVPRNLNSYIISFYDKLGDRVFTRMTTIHFPIALAHALLFYYVCQVFVNMMEADAAIESAVMSHYTSCFVLLYASLLLLNSLWLFRITPEASSTQPGTIWAYNNIVHVALSLAVFLAFKTWAFSNSVMILSACVTFISNSVIDLSKASKFYILYER